jgi:membrane protein implicated in regulation of membrane protease activity
MFEGLELHWLWLIAAAVLASAEIVVPGVFLIFLAGAAALTAAAAAVGLPFPIQLALFPLFALGSVWFGKRWYHRNPVASSDPLLNDRAARLIGQVVVVAETIEHGTGRVRVGDSVWNARGENAAIGTRVRVTGVEGTCLRVERLLPLPSAESDASGSA